MMLVNPDLWDEVEILEYNNINSDSLNETKIK